MKFSCQECRAGRNQYGKWERNLGEEDHMEKNGVRKKSEMDERRKQAQDKVVREVLKKAKEDGNRALKEIDEEVKESCAAERREKSISESNTAHSVKGMATRVRAALAEEGWVQIGDQLVSKKGDEEGVWRMIKAVVETMEARDRELKLANERIGVLTWRVEELEQERSRKYKGQEKGKEQAGRSGKDEGGGELQQKGINGRVRQPSGRQGGQKKSSQDYPPVGKQGKKKSQQSYSQVVTRG